MPRTRTPALVALVAIVVMPAAAEAGTVRAEPDGDGAVLAFSAAPGEANRLTLRADAGAIVVTDEVRCMRAPGAPRARAPSRRAAGPRT